jgi:hypothetical protein
MLSLAARRAEIDELKRELVRVLEQPLPGASHAARETLISCSQVRQSCNFSSSLDDN